MKPQRTRKSINNVEEEQDLKTSYNFTSKHFAILQ